MIDFLRKLWNWFYDFVDEGKLHKNDLSDIDWFSTIPAVIVVGIMIYLIILAIIS